MLRSVYRPNLRNRKTQTSFFPANSCPASVAMAPVKRGRRGLICGEVTDLNRLVLFCCFENNAHSKLTTAPCLFRQEEPSSQTSHVSKNRTQSPGLIFALTWMRLRPGCSNYRTQYEVLKLTKTRRIFRPCACGCLVHNYTSCQNCYLTRCSPDIAARAYKHLYPVEEKAQAVLPATH